MGKRRIKITIAGDEELKAKLKRMGQAVVHINRDAALAAANVIENAAEPNAPGPHVEIELVKADENRAEVNIGPDKEHWYYQFFETGATQHEITPHAKRVLAFEGRHGLVITKKVKHPGIPAKPFLRPAMQNQQDEARETAGRVFRQAIERFVE